MFCGASFQVSAGDASAPACENLIGIVPPSGHAVVDNVITCARPPRPPPPRWPPPPPPPRCPCGGGCVCCPCCCVCCPCCAGGFCANTPMTKDNDAATVH